MTLFLKCHIKIVTTYTIFCSVSFSLYLRKQHQLLSRTTITRIKERSYIIVEGSIHVAYVSI